MASIEENEREGDDEYTAWEHPFERQIRALDAALNPARSVIDSVRAAQRSVESVQRYHLDALAPAFPGASLRAITSGLDDAVRQHDQMMTALGYIKVRRRRYAQPTPSRPRTPLPTASHPTSPPSMAETYEPDAVTVTPQKRGRGRQPGHRTINPMHFDRLMCAYCVEKSATPSRRKFQVFAAHKYKTVDCHTLTTYANDYCQTDWAGVRLLYGQRFGVE